MKFLLLNFLPRSADVALLLLRIWHGAALLLLHGWGKVTGFSAMADKFLDPFGLGKTPSLALAVVGEAVCSTLIVLGLFTRVAALGSAATMATAFWFAHGGRLTGTGNGELAIVYLGVFLALFIAGGVESTPWTQGSVRKGRPGSGKRRHLALTRALGLATM